MGAILLRVVVWYILTRFPPREPVLLVGMCGAGRGGIENRGCWCWGYCDPHGTTLFDLEPQMEKEREIRSRFCRGLGTQMFFFFVV